MDTLVFISALESNIETAITEKPKNEVTALDRRWGMIYGQMHDGQKVFVYHLINHNVAQVSFFARHQVTVPVSTLFLCGYVKVKNNYQE